MFFLKMFLMLSIFLSVRRYDLPLEVVHDMW